jgi:hypothetical protein
MDRWNVHHMDSEWQFKSNRQSVSDFDPLFNTLSHFGEFKSAQNSAFSSKALQNFLESKFDKFILTPD